MPHVVIQGPVTVEDVHLAFRPMEFREGTARYKAEESYLLQDKTALLIRSMTVERGFVKSFFVRISSKGEDQITIGLEKTGRPELSDGVRRLIALYALLIIRSEPQAHVVTTNIPEQLKEALPE